MDEKRGGFELPDTLTVGDGDACGTGCGTHGGSYCDVSAVSDDAAGDADFAATEGMGMMLSPEQLARLKAAKKAAAQRARQRSHSKD